LVHKKVVKKVPFVEDYVLQKIYLGIMCHVNKGLSLNYP